MGFWEGLGKFALFVLKEAIKPSCPNCNSSNFRYGYSFIKNFGVVNLINAGISLATNNIANTLHSSGNFFSGVLSSFVNQNVDNIPSNPILQCLNCSIYFVECPSCSKPQALKEYATTGSIYQCGNCNNKFGVCARSDKFDKLVNE